MLKYYRISRNFSIFQNNKLNSTSALEALRDAVNYLQTYCIWRITISHFEYEMGITHYFKQSWNSELEVFEKF